MYNDRCNYCFDQRYSHYNFVENNGIIILNNTTLNDLNNLPHKAHTFKKVIISSY